MQKGSHLLGIEIGGTKLQLVLGNALGEIQDRRRLTVAPAQGASGIQQQIQSHLPELVAGRKINAVGVGFGGPVDWKAGRIARSHQIEGWSDFDLSAWLGGLTGARVVADNDANVAALAEAVCGAGVGFNPIFYVTLGSGVGGGAVLDGKIYHGAAPGESELGHVRLDRAGTTVESRCSGWAVDARIFEHKALHPHSHLAHLCGMTAGGAAKHLAPALARGDLDARRILDEVTGDLAFGLSHVVHLFHPAVIILGGGLSKVGEQLRAGVQAALAPLLMEVFRPGPPIRLSALGEDVVPVGALCLAAQAAESTPLATS